jgi:hypothetical protein
MTSSISSNASTVVSFRDEEIDLDEALRVLYQELQENLNHSQCSIRQLSMCSERNDDFIEAANIYLELNDYIDVLLDLFTELKSVSKQCLGKPPQEVKEEFNKMLNDRKEKKKQAKQQAKEAEKKVKMMDIIQE